MLYLIRGWPGSGKSTIGERLAGQHCYSADQFFEQGGAYCFDPTRLQEAHQYCKDKVLEALTDEVPVVAVANTFVRQWEMKWYKDAAAQCGYSVFVLRCENNFTNVHGVPQATVDKMRERME